jgi:MurNAc alpha-1-phosphate uridylyltransferase
MQVVILAGGLGSRLGPLTTSLPKSLVSVASRPFASWQLDLIAQQGVTDVIYSVGYLGDQIEAFIGDGSKWGVSVGYSYEGNRLLGTGGALRLAHDRQLLDREFFVLYGDSYVLIDFDAVARAFRASGLPALMTVYRNDGRLEVGNACFDGSLVTAYDKTARADDQDLRFVDYGLSVLTSGVIGQHVPLGAPADLADTFRELSRSRHLAGFEADHRFYEIGSLDGLLELESYLSQ